MPSEFKYRSILYKDYFNNQSGRTFQLDIKRKMEEEEHLLSKEIIPLLPQDKYVSILDIGCGFGSLIYTLKKNGYTNIKGIDLSEGQVKVAHELGLHEVEKQDINSFLSLNKNNFDVIIGLDIIEHFSKDELVSVLLLIKESLKPRGITIFRTPNADAPFASMYGSGDFTHENILNNSSAHQLFMSLGFIQIKVADSHLETSGVIKEVIRKISWFILKLSIRIIIFSTARSYKNITLTPNLLIKAERSTD